MFCKIEEVVVHFQFVFLGNIDGVGPDVVDQANRLMM
ncbi:hypothetical protein QFZ87_004705 [Bacillus sp. SLBN-46]|nr:hypothetical protein [Bacillus sp. SLBN-46]